MKSQTLLWKQNKKPKSIYEI